MAILMNKDTPILEVEIEKGDIISTGKVLCEEMLPIPLQDGFTLETANKWFGTRRIPDKREGMTEARSQFRGFEEDRNYFSLSDQYWVRHNKNETWKKLNFFTNRYSQEVGKIFFEPWNVDQEKLAQPSPDRTTNGVLRKRWVQDESGKSYLIKAGSVLYHQEPLSEVMASIMLKKLKMIDFVEYEMLVDGMRFCSKCPNFVDASTEFVPASAIYSKIPRKQSETVYEHLLTMCTRYNIIGAREYIDHMIVVDHVLCNTDRHLGNFGFLRSAETGKILGFAPLFDCGSAYWGTTNTVKENKSRLFSDCEKDIISKAAKRGLLKNAKTTSEMYRLLDMYPEIRSEKKAKIKKMINDMDLEVERMSGASENEKDKRHDIPDLEIEF